MAGRGKGCAIDPLGIAAGFVRRARHSRSDEELRAVLSDATESLGFDAFALVHHADLSRGAAALIRIDSYPAEWSAGFIAAGLHAVDPVHQASLQTHFAFAWDDLPRMIRLTPRQRAILEAGARSGLRFGITVPVHVPGEPSGSCSFASRRRSTQVPLALVATQVIGGFAFECARRLLRGDAPLRRTPRLSPRQHDCLLLAAQGKSDWEIGRILGLAEETVTKYLNAARARYGVARRTQLAVSALYDGEISFSEVIGRP